MENGFVFSKCQKKGFSKIEEFLRSDKYAYLLTGGGGVGKTSMLKKIINKREDIYFFCVAFTNKATGILRQKIGRNKNSNASTLTQFLGKKMEYDINGKEIFSTKSVTKTIEYKINEMELDHKKYHEEKKENCKIENCDYKMEYRQFVLIVDECSMITDDDFEMLNDDDLIRTGLKIIYVGDDYQLPPISKLSTLSKVFTSKYPKFEMTTIMRTNNNEIMELFQMLRQCIDTHEDPIKYFNYIQQKNQEKNDEKDEKKILILDKKNFEEEIKKSKTEIDSKVVAWRHIAVDKYNKIIKDRKEGDPEFMKNDKKQFSKYFKLGDNKFFREEHIIIEEVEYVTRGSEYFGDSFDSCIMRVRDEGGYVHTINKIIKKDIDKFDKVLTKKKNKIKRMIIKSEKKKKKIK